MAYGKNEGYELLVESVDDADFPSQSKEYELYSSENKYDLQDIILFPSDLSLFMLSYYIPDPEPEDSIYNEITWLKFGGAIFIAFFSSLFYKPFCAAFTEQAAKKININDNAAAKLAEVAGFASFFVNFAITFVSLLAAYETFKELPDKLAEADFDKYGDKLMVIGLLSIIAASIIATVPSLVFVLDTMKQQAASAAYTAFNLIMQLIANVAMMIRGGLSVINLETEKTKAAEAIRLSILIELNKALENPLDHSDLVLLSQGEQYHRRFLVARNIAGKIGYLMPIVYILGVFAASLTVFAPFLVGTGIIVGLIATVNILIALISASLLFMLMGFGNAALIDRLFSGKDSKILEIKGLFDNPDIPAVVMVLSVIVALGLSLLSMGGPAAVVFNYLFPNVYAAFIGGFVAAFGMNTGDLLDLLSTYTTLVVYKIMDIVEYARCYFAGKEYVKKEKLPWETRDQFIQSRMQIVSRMDDHKVVTTYGERVRALPENEKDDLLNQMFAAEEQTPQPQTLYNGRIEFNASKTFEDVVKVCRSEALAQSEGDGFNKVSGLYANRHTISSRWQEMQRENDDVEGLVIPAAAATA